MAESNSYHHGGCNNKGSEKFKWYFNSEDTLIGLSCTECFSEWVTSEYVLDEHRGSEVISVDKQTFHLIKKPEEDVSTFPTPSTKIDDLENLGLYLSPGDHITYHWCAGFAHHAIVKDIRRKEHGPDEIILIHWQGGQDETNSKSSAEVVEETIDNMSTKTSVIYKTNYSKGSVRKDNIVLTLARADSCVGETGYNLTENNCEHFAVFCKTGHHRSHQVEHVEEVFSGLMRCAIKYTDMPVEKITDLSIGDHIVIFMWFLHPRCHMIVTGVDSVKGEIGVIRFTYARGVVEEKLKFRKPLYKVLYEKAVPPREVIRRARIPIDVSYDIVRFNCKHFAFLCNDITFDSPDTVNYQV